MKILIFVCVYGVQLFVHSAKGEESGSEFQPKEAIMATVEEAFDAWLDMEKEAKEGVEKLIDQMMNHVLDSESQVEVSAECIEDLLRVIVDLKKLKLWALKLLDANPKPPPAFLLGVGALIGNLQECLDIEFPNGPGRQTITTGKFCIMEMASALPPKTTLLRMGMDIFKNINRTFETELFQHVIRYFGPVSYSFGLKLGICVPSTCSIEDLNLFLKSKAKHSAVLSCEVKQPLNIDSVQWIIIGCFGFIALLNVFGIIFDLNYKESTKGLGTWLTLAKTFSPIRNIRAVAKVQPSTGFLDCCNGIRFLAMCFIIFGHTYISIPFTMLDNVWFMPEVASHWTAQFIANTTNNVQTFFVVSGVLISYNLVKAYDTKGNRSFNVAFLIIKRALRLLPVVIFTLGTVMIMPLMGSGPFWTNFFIRCSEICRKRWWYLPLFINNFQKLPNNCLPHTWYVSTDMQMYILFLFYYWLLFRKPILSYMFLGLMIVASVVIQGAITWVYDMAPTQLPIITDIDYLFHHQQLLYLPVYCYSGLYAIAVGTGTLLARNENIKISKVVLLLGTVTSGILLLLIIYGTKFWNSGVDWTPWTATLYGSMYKTAWGLVICWMIFVCAIGKGGFVNDFLSWGGFQSLIRISYAIYVIHFFIINTYGLSRPHTVYAAHSTFVWLFFGNLVVSLLAGLGARIFFESPVNELLDMVFLQYNGISKKGKENSKSESIVGRQEPAGAVTDSCDGERAKG